MSDYTAAIELVQARLREERRQHDGTHRCDWGDYHLETWGDCVHRQVTESKQKILDAHLTYYGDMPDECLPVPVVSLLAAPYLDEAGAR